MLEFFIFILILGALAGGKSFGGTIAKGIKVLLLLILIVLIFSVFVSEPNAMMIK